VDPFFIREFMSYLAYFSTVWEPLFGRREAKKPGKNPDFMIPFILQALGLCRNPPDPRKSAVFSGPCNDFCPLA
jgi:hypothetical protein